MPSSQRLQQQLQKALIESEAMRTDTARLVSQLQGSGQEPDDFLSTTDVFRTRFPNEPRFQQPEVTHPQLQRCHTQLPAYQRTSYSGHGQLSTVAEHHSNNRNLMTCDTIISDNVVQNQYKKPAQQQHQPLNISPTKQLHSADLLSNAHGSNEVWQPYLKLLEDRNSFYTAPERQLRLEQVNPPQQSLEGQLPSGTHASCSSTKIVDFQEPTDLSSHISSAVSSIWQRSQGYPCLLVHIGTVEFDSFGNLGVPGLFETSVFRILIQKGGRAPTSWAEELPASKQRELSYTRIVSDDGRYSARISCDFNEVLELPFPEDGIPELLSADLWHERRTVVETLDSILDKVGLGNNLPEFERKFLGRARISIPPLDVEAVPQVWPIQADRTCDGPVPKELSVNVAWRNNAVSRPKLRNSATL